MTQLYQINYQGFVIVSPLASQLNLIRKEPETFRPELFLFSYSLTQCCKINEYGDAVQGALLRLYRSVLSYVRTQA